MCLAMETVISEKNIELLVDRFYAKIRTHPQLGPIFNGVIGYSDEQWQPHLSKICDFWSSIMLGGGRYKGNPLKKHQEVPPFDIGLFKSWLDLFYQTAQSLYSPQIAEQFREKSHQIAHSLQWGLYGYKID